MFYLSENEITLHEQIHQSYIKKNIQLLFTQ